MCQISKFFFIFSFLVFVSSDLFSQKIIEDSITNEMKNGTCENVGKKISTGFKHTKSKIIQINKDINEVDTGYISPNLYNLAFMVQHSSWHEIYRMGGNKQSITLSPNFSYKLGLYFGWRWIFLGYSFDVDDIFGNNKNKINKTELNLNLYTSKIGVDLYYRKTGNDYKIRNLKGFDAPESLRDFDFDGFQSSIKGINAYWIFNHKHFSYPAVYSQSTNQRKSTGSLMAGLSYSEHNISFDYTQLPPYLKNDLSERLMFKKIKYYDYSINIGYGYNWVFKKNWVANLSLLPAIGYKKTVVKSTKDYIDNHWTHNINFDLITRAGLVYNDSKYYAGTSLVIHTYSYQKQDLSITNSFGSLNFYLGFNFWKKQQKKQ